MNPAFAVPPMLMGVDRAIVPPDYVRERRWHDAYRYMLNVAEEEFRRFLRHHGPFELMRLVCEHDLESELLVATASFRGGLHIRWQFTRDVMREISADQVRCYEGDCASIYQLIAQQHPAYRRPLVELEERQVDLAPSELVAASTATEIRARGFDLRPGAVNWEVYEEFARVQRAHFDQLLFGNFGRAPGYAEAEAKADKLLREWLSPAQLEQLEAHGYFEVVGSDTGAVYRIRRGSSYNIDKLGNRGKSGKVLETYCVVPDGAGAVGDIMLAQKVMLETREKATLKIANRHGDMFSMALGFGWLAPTRAVRVHDGSSWT